MSSSSAYSNVLLKPSVQQQPAAAPKRDYQDDLSTADFSRTLKDVSDTERQREETVSKPTVKKAAPIQGREKSVEKTKEKDSVEYADKSDVKPVSKKKDVSDDKTVGDKELKKSDEAVDPSTLATAPVTQPAATETNLPGELATLPCVGADQSTEETADALTPTEANSTISALTTDASGDTNLTGVEIKPDLPLQDTAPDPAVNQVAQDGVATLNAATQLKVPVDAAASATTEDAAATLSAVVGDIVPDKTATKTSGADANSLAKAELEAEATAEQTTFQATDSKSVFEKMLQTVARSGSNVQDDKAALTPAQNNSSNTSSSTGLDSLMRFSDTQTPAARSFVVQTAVPVPVGQPQWSQAVGEKVLWLAAQNISSAEINLHPKDLGPMQVKVSVNQDQTTTVSFTSHHPVVREVLDQNLNRLRDMFSEQGLNLVNVDVSDKSFSRQQGDPQDQKGQGGTNGTTPEEETVVAVSTIVQQRLVDHYA